MEQRESAARQALRKKRARKRAVRTAVFLALAAAAAVCIVSLAFWYAVPPSPAQASPAAVEPLRESFRVDLNTAGVDAMTTLPGLGEKKARAILEYRLAHGRFQSLDEVAQVPGVTQDMIDEWQGLAYVS